MGRSRTYGRRMLWSGWPDLLKSQESFWNLNIFLIFFWPSDFFWILNFFYICSTALLGRWNTIIIHYCTITNSYVETILSHMKHVWSDNPNRLGIELVSAELTIRMNDNYSCQRFYQYILSETKLLKKIWKNAKYA